MLRGAAASRLCVGSVVALCPPNSLQERALGIMRCTGALMLRACRGASLLRDLCCVQLCPPAPYMVLSCCGFAIAPRYCVSLVVWSRCAFTARVCVCGYVSLLVSSCDVARCGCFTLVCWFRRCPVPPSSIQKGALGIMRCAGTLMLWVCR